MNYGVGDEVVCISTIPIGEGSKPARAAIRAGDTYKVHAIIGDRKCIELVGIVAPPISFGSWGCGVCGDEGTLDGLVYFHYGPWRFIKLPKLTIDAEQEATA